MRAPVIILQVEDPRGADAADEIAALPGVDMLWLGHNDLSVAMNKPGAFDRSAVPASTRRRRSRRRRSTASRPAGSASMRGKCAEFVKLGYDFVAIAGDVWLLQQAFAAGVATVRKE